MADAANAEQGTGGGTSGLVSPPTEAIGVTFRCTSGSGEGSFDAPLCGSTPRVALVSSDAADESISDDSPLFGRPRVVCNDELVEAAEVNERAAAVSTYWAALYGEYAAGLAGFLTKVVGDREVAAELVQETFVRAIRAEPVDQRFVRRWLYRIASNLARDHHRHRRLLRFVPFSGIERGPSGIPDPEIDIIHRALQALPAAQATTLLLHYDAGFSRSEIAAMEGITEEAVKSRLARGRERFIREFERLGRVDGR